MLLFTCCAEKLFTMHIKSRRAICAGVRYLSSLHALQSLSMRFCKAVLGQAFSEFSEVKSLRSLCLANCVSLSLEGAHLSSCAHV